MDALKKEVLEFLNSEHTTPQAQFGQALMLLGRSGNGAASSLRHYNSQGYSAQRLEGILYDLQKANAISDIEKFQYVCDVDKEPAANASQKSSNIMIDLGPIQQDLEKSDNDTKSGLKLRAQYPFLSDPDVPEEFLILIGHKMTAFDEFIKGQEQLSVLIYGDEEKGIAPQELTQEDLFNLGGKLIENWELNDQIKDELDFYQENGTVLGNHPRLWELKKTEQISSR